MNAPKLPICYLCGLPITGKVSRDHVVPKQMIKRLQPRAKGYDYADTIDSHETCNNLFGPEGYLRAAITILAGLNDSEAVVYKQHVTNPNLCVLFINAEKFPGLSELDLQFFGIANAPNEHPNGVPPPEFFHGRRKTNLLRDAMYTAFSVIAKSSAALLLTRHSISIPTQWKIYATAYWDQSDVFDLDEHVGKTIPFDDGLKAWIKSASADAWQVIYRYEHLVVVLLFDFATAKTNVLEQLRNALSSCEIHAFIGGCLNDLMRPGWQPV